MRQGDAAHARWRITRRRHGAARFVGGFDEGNPLFRMTFEWLRPQIEIGYDLGRRIRNLPLAAVSPQTTREHGQILEAIQAHDGEAAGQAMYDHLLAGINRLFSRDRG
jgi:DNA-binding FadR family transcriptional regulator